MSLPSNIAEGRTRKSSKEYRQFLSVAFGSGAELETQIQIAINQGFITSEDSNKANNLLSEVMRMLNSLINKLQ